MHFKTEQKQNSMQAKYVVKLHLSWHQWKKSSLQSHQRQKHIY